MKLKFCACAAGLVVLVMGAYSGVYAQGNNAGTVNCDRPNASLQDAIDDSEPGDTIFVVGSCEEDVTITKDRITLNGDPNQLELQGGDGTVNGSITIEGADNIAIEFLTIAEGRFGVGVADTGDVDINGSIIENTDIGGVFVENESVIRLKETLVRQNAGDLHGSGVEVFVQRNSVIDLACNNEIRDDAGRALFLEEGSALRQDECSVADRNIITAPVSVDVFNGSIADLRGSDVTGSVSVAGSATFRVQNSSIDGNIEAKVNSFVGFRPVSQPSDPEFPMDFFGTLTCDTTSGIFEGVKNLDNVECGQTCSGSVPGTCS